MKPDLSPVQTGLEIFLAEHSRTYKGRSLALLANQASIGPGYRHALSYLDEYLPGRIKAVFSPQHGFKGEKQDNMVESGHGRLKDGRPLFSLYSDLRQPEPSMLQDIDVLLIDLTDIGTRVYTFAQTMSLCLEAAGDSDLEIVILDRPNPLGGLTFEGNLLDISCRSFVGRHPMPMRHGLTMGEMAVFFNSQLEKPAALSVIPCRHWTRDRYFPGTGLPWVMPSPNMPTFETAWVYPGQVLWEGTNISEGRGTAKPFLMFGAPFIDPEILAGELRSRKLPGAVFREVWFQPTFHKWEGQYCGGLEIHPLNHNFEPYLTSLTCLEIILKFWSRDFRLKEPPYEYEYTRRPIDLILGRESIFNELADGRPAREIIEASDRELKKWRRDIKKYLLYS
ncbi:MAG: DUF1343 domain-containing protein [Deltaproteobacteria bacterium]|jgi:uncharacterized protein YbbC (DUF1343 family)|nr:DUF1343 domain-containing protein [Deltaproteobacteria bacterium]